jgi:hypothetical protein
MAAPIDRRLHHAFTGPITDPMRERRSRCTMRRAGAVGGEALLCGPVG